MCKLRVHWYPNYVPFDASQKSYEFKSSVKFVKFGLNVSKRAKEPSQAQLEFRKRSRQKSSKAEQTKLIKQCT